MSAPSEAGTAWEFPIERGKIREFALAMQSEAPEYQHPDAVVPPTFLINANRWAPEGARVPHGFDRRRLLHGEQEYIFHGPPPRAGQTLYAAERLAERYEKPGRRGGTMKFAVIVTEFRDEAGTLVAEGRATYIETAKATKTAEPAKTAQPRADGATGTEEKA
ncbi:MaoC family dehydratase N-terminal domain-containing protein [Frankia gtarii]|uniref:MaoC family dehydratase N-terminal domain-containing protein n=1 Tax=Frankia gtarii TaxID=2950102 RepID=UPI0021BE79B6|nr:MaoC family dehydratase N-terminal domain-containing protein [Frankia gtarii]